MHKKLFILCLISKSNMWICSHTNTKKSQDGKVVAARDEKELKSWLICGFNMATTKIANHQSYNETWPLPSPSYNLFFLYLLCSSSSYVISFISSLSYHLYLYAFSELRHLSCMHTHATLCASLCHLNLIACLLVFLFHMFLSIFVFIYVKQFKHQPAFLT